MNVTITKIYMAVVRYNKDGTVRKHRKIKSLRGKINHTQEVVGSITKVIASVEARAAKGEMVLTLDRASGNITASSEALIVDRKLARRNYVIVGYMPEARLTNTSRRAVGLPLQRLTCHC